MLLDSLQQQFSEEELNRHIRDSNSGGDYVHWKRIRRFITKAIHKDGTFLDIGCANGFLMQCLMHWSEYSITPYGIDNREEAIESAKKLLPGYSDHFQCLDGDRLDQLEAADLPSQYDFVYRNYWKADTTKDYASKVISDLLSHVHEGGRAIIGLYWGISHPQNSHEYKNAMESFHSFIDLLKEAAGHFDGEVFSDSGSSHWLMWIDR